MLNINLQHQLLQQSFQQIETTLLNPSDMFADMGEFLTSSTQDRFRTSTAPDGSKWQNNSESTYLSMLGDKDTKKDGTLSSRGIKRVMNKRPLVGKGNLMHDIHYQISGDILLVGSNMEYAAAHQFGVTITPKNKKMLSWKIGGVSVFAKKVVIPQREFLGISLADEVELVAIAEDHLLSL